VQSRRRRSCSCRIWRGQDDPKYVVTAETFDSRDVAEAVWTSPATKDSMEGDGIEPHHADTSRVKHTASSFHLRKAIPSCRRSILLPLLLLHQICRIDLPLLEDRRFAWTNKRHLILALHIVDADYISGLQTCFCAVDPLNLGFNTDIYSLSSRFVGLTHFHRPDFDDKRFRRLLLSLLVDEGWQLGQTDCAE
jgi:hypothetical protein